MSHIKGNWKLDLILPMPRYEAQKTTIHVIFADHQTLCVKSGPYLLVQIFLKFS